MLKQIKLNAINEVIIKVQSYLFSIYKSENTVMSMTIQQIDKSLQNMNVVEIKNMAQLEPNQIIAQIG